MLNSVNIVEDVLSVNVNNCVVVLYVHIILKGDVNNVIAVANPFPEQNAFAGICTSLLTAVWSVNVIYLLNLALY